jgi:hypothetical protein
MISTRVKLALVLTQRKSMKRFKLTYCSLLLIICAGFLQSCARKTIQSVERSTDSVVIVKTDSVIVRDTIKTISKMETVDSIVERTEKYVIVDTLGKVIGTYVIHDKNVYHNKNALSDAHHISNRVNNKVEKEHKVKSKDVETKIDKHSSSRLQSLFRYVLFAVLVSIVMIIYRHIYNKRK